MLLWIIIGVSGDLGLELGITFLEPGSTIKSNRCSTTGLINGCAPLFYAKTTKTDFSTAISNITHP